VVDVSGVVDRVPEVGWLPLHPPDALQDCASLAFHCSVMDWPASILAELTCRLMVGGCADTEEGLEPALADDRPSPWHAANTAAATATAVPRARRKPKAARFIHDLPIRRSVRPSRATGAIQVIAGR
jgi:hypothetical protein